MIATDSAAPPAAPSPPAPLWPTKIQGRHRERLALVYVRQSTPQQVLEHQESTALQYALRARAIDWAWSPERVMVIDDDLGCSGTSAVGRTGFQRLLSEVSLDHVGLVLGIEMSRLARCCKDWHQLLEVCALFGTLLADQDGLYDPREYNDRLLLGLKGTLSEAELHLLHQRMHQGRLNKARRGELFNHAAIGYVRLPTGELAMDPDEQVQAVVRLLFERFEELGTINAVLRFFVAQGIRLPIRLHYGPNRGHLEWRTANRQTLRSILHHPVYAGAYSWGRRALDPRKKIPGRPATGRKVVSPEQCQVLLRDRCPAYITWEHYQANQQRLANNQAQSDRPGAVREGPALLKGLLVCGRCGRRMTVSYPRSGSDRGRLRYTCSRAYSDRGGPLCQSLVGRALEDLVSQLLLTVLEPAALELSLSAAADLQRQRQQLDQHWHQRLERAAYEADRAARRCQAVEPENRLVGRELERQWEQKLLEQRALIEAHDRFRQQHPPELSDNDRQQVRALAQDLPALWHSPQTTPQDRQIVVRHLVERIVVTAPKDNPQVDLTMHWAGGFVSHYHFLRPVACYQRMPDYPQLLTRIRQLHGQNHTMAQIAHQLNHEGFRPPKRRATFNGPMVRTLLCRQQRSGPRPREMEEQRLEKHEWWFTDLARYLALPQPTLYSWLRRGWLRGRQWPATKGRGRWILWADPEEVDRLRRLRTCPRSWFNQPQAAELTHPEARPTESQNL